MEDTDVFGAPMASRPNAERDPLPAPGWPDVAPLVTVQAVPTPPPVASVPPADEAASPMDDSAPASHAALLPDDPAPAPDADLPPATRAAPTPTALAPVAEPAMPAPTADQAPAPAGGTLARMLARAVTVAPRAGQRLSRLEVALLLEQATTERSRADLRGADLRGADLSGLDLTGARLGDDDPLASEDERRTLAARLDHAVLAGANLERVVAPGVSFAGADLRAARLAEAVLTGADLSGANLERAWLVSVQATDADLRASNLGAADLRGALLVGANLTGAVLGGARLEHTDLGLANLTGADLRFAFCDEATYLGGALLDGATLEGLRYRDVDLLAVDWSAVQAVGEERLAAKAQPHLRSPAYHLAARTYRRLGAMLRAQGLSADGQRFLARARQMESRALASLAGAEWRGGQYHRATLIAARWLIENAPGALTAFGARPTRALGWAVLLAVAFAGLQWLAAPLHALSFGGALLLSLGALVGRGFFAPTAPGLPDLLAILESVLGTVLILTLLLALARRALD